MLVELKIKVTTQKVFHDRRHCKVKMVVKDVFTREKRLQGSQWKVPHRRSGERGREEFDDEIKERCKMCKVRNAHVSFCRQ